MTNIGCYEPKHLRPEEISALSARLKSRANSVLMNDRPEQRNDLRMAARILDELVHHKAEMPLASV